MYAKIVGIILMGIGVFGTVWLICRRRSNGSAVSGTGRNADPVTEHLDSAGRRNSDIEAAERRAADLERQQAETIGRAAEGNKQGQELVQKAQHILHSAKHTSSNR